MQLTFSAHGIRRPSLLQFVGRESWPRRLLNAMVLAAIAIALAPAAGQAQVPALPERWTLTNVNVVDIENGGILADRAVRIQGGHIAAVVPMDRLIETRGTRRIDARGGYLIPGLYDVHVHLAANGNVADSTLMRLIASGVVGVRDMGFPLDSISSLSALSRKQRGGTGPRIWYTGPILNAPPLPPDFPPQIAATDTTQIRDIIKRSRAAGSNAVKIHDRLTLASYRLIASTARGAHLPLVGHLPALVPLDEVITERQYSVEHLGGLTHGILMACSRDASARSRVAGALVSDDFMRLYAVSMSAAHLSPLLDGFDSTQCEHVAARLRQAGVWQVPNLLLWRAWASDTSEHPSRSDLDARRRLYSTTKEIVSIMHGAGVPLLAGTDGVESIHEELALLVEAGVSPLDAIRAATQNPARFLGVADSVGAVRTGFVADLVLLGGNPLSDIKNTRQVRAVVFGGKIVSSSSTSRQ